ncbi:Di-sulfide bridge nucleocytoplasmic transport domain-containing protein [Mariannaea sp. PMI_226]|nr:Di-sulfide bridge nucleocytoplasmic transport domain-containing protein [Mariannaea sp. PMI_226]
MDRRTYEGPMDWEYQGTGALDPTSPFTHATKNGQQNRMFDIRALFASASKPLSRPNPFSNLTTPSKSQQLPPQLSAFTPQLPPKASAPPFRNPAFTTPRRPFDEVALSEASGAEDSPAFTETSDFPNDTPEADRMGDVVMGGLPSPSKIDKSLRYGRSTLSSKKHASGRGEIRGARDMSAVDFLRKRKRHNYDKDVVRHQSQGWDDSDVDSDDSMAPQARNRSRSKKSKSLPSRGIVGTLFHTLDEHPNAPENLFRWIQLLVNFFLVSVFVYIGWAIVDTVRSDIRNANEAARLELMSKMTECQNQYTLNECSKKDRPALKMMCDEWYDCMMQNPESIMRVKVTAKQIAEIINEFSDAMNLKAWAFFFAILILCAFANNLTLGRYNKATPAAPVPSASIHDPAIPLESGPGYMWVPVQTPHTNRHALLDEGTDTDTSPPKMKPLLAAPYTPSGRRSPSKRDRSLSPVKYGRSPSKGSEMAR